jgi:KAP family P-loop domain
METLYFKEVFQYPISEFKAHLEQQTNERIIFSGKYGIGKTRFLEDFFNLENQEIVYESVKYNVYRLFPTNYSIASNEDILRYIKYDIIIEMLKKSITLEEIKFSLLDTFPIYLKDNIHKVTAGLVRMIPKLGKEIVECFDRIDKLKEEYLKEHDELNKTPGDRLVEYLEKMESKDGGIYESDITTKIISEAITKDETKESILIIDDIDRLDPEHVFRILNVFASHFDANTISGNKNKFNFDKIILVCDFNNIRNIFHHRYGLEVDFMGYIDKFYSSDIYYFDNRKAITGIIKQIFNSINFEGKNGDDPNILRQFYFQNGFLADLVNLFLSQGLLSLRNIIKLYKRNISYHYEKIYFDSRNSEIAAWMNPIMMQLKLLRDLFGDYRNMKNAFERLKFTDDFFENHERRFAELIYILSSKIHNYYSRAEFLYTFKGKPIVMEVKRRFQNDQFESGHLYNWNNEMKDENTPVKGEHLKISELMFKDGLIESIQALHQTGYLK